MSLERLIIEILKLVYPWLKTMAKKTESKIDDFIVRLLGLLLDMDDENNGVTPHRENGRGRR